MQCPHLSEAKGKGSSQELGCQLPGVMALHSLSRVAGRASVGLVVTWPPHLCVWTTEQLRPTDSCRLPVVKVGPKVRGPSDVLSLRPARMFLARHSSLDRSEILSGIIFLQPKVLSLAFLVLQVCLKQILLFFFSLKIALLHLQSWRLFSLDIESGFLGLFVYFVVFVCLFQAFKDAPLSSGLHNFS